MNSVDEVAQATTTNQQAREKMAIAMCATYNWAAYNFAARNEIRLLLHIEMAGNGTREMGYSVS